MQKLSVFVVLLVGTQPTRHGLRGEVDKSQTHEQTRKQPRGGAPGPRGGVTPIRGVHQREHGPHLEEEEKGWGRGKLLVDWIWD